MRPRSIRSILSAQPVKGVAALAAAAALASLTATGATGAQLQPDNAAAAQVASSGALADATVRADWPAKNYGWTSTLDADVGPDRHGYLLFDVQGLAGPVRQATLSLYVTRGAGVSADVRSVSNTSWGEKTITWNNAPAPGPVISSLTLVDGRVSFDVTSAVTGNGRVAFVLTSPGERSTVYSREAALANAPSLSVTTAETVTPPANTALPSLSGTAQAGQSLTTTSGSWSGTTPMTYAYQWQRCNSAGASCAAIAGAAAASYALVSADVGFTVRAQATATNTVGSATATSAPSAVVQAAPPLPPPPPPGSGDAGRFGISGMTSTLSYESSADFTKDMGTIDASGAGWIRIDINWAVIQRDSPTSYDWAPFDRIVVDARARGLNVLGIIDYTPPWARPVGGDAKTPPKNVSDYAGFASAVAKHYSPMGVHAYEIWNEPNLGVNWKPSADAARYTQFLQAAYVAIHQADSSATVVTGGLSPATTNGKDIDPRTFVQAMYANGAKGYFDALGHHPYCFPAAPGDAQSWSAWYQMYGTSTSLRSTMIANGDGDKKIWATEFGVPTNGPSGSYLSEGMQAQHLKTAYELFGSYSWAGPLFAYSSRDNGTDTGTNYNFYGLTRFDFSAKPAFAAYQAAAAAG